jgi:hypothetical protein
MCPVHCGHIYGLFKSHVSGLDYITWRNRTTGKQRIGKNVEEAVLIQFEQLGFENAFLNGKDKVFPFHA